VDAADAPERAALGGDVGSGGEPRADEPLREAGVEAAGNRILVSAAADERPHLEGGVVAGLLRADHAELERVERRPVGLERKHLARRAQHHRAPAGAVVHPLVPHDVRRR